MKSILIIDDDEINNFISIKLIKKALLDTEIMVCLNGKYAINVLVDIEKKQTKFPDYILLDTNMPIMNGWQFLDEYNRLGFDKYPTKIYMIASSVFSNDINRARSYPVLKDFISKPLNVEKINTLFNN